MTEHAESVADAEVIADIEARIKILGDEIAALSKVRAETIRRMLESRSLEQVAKELGHTPAVIKNLATGWAPPGYRVPRHRSTVQHNDGS